MGEDTSPAKEGGPFTDNGGALLSPGAKARKVSRKSCPGIAAPSLPLDARQSHGVEIAPHSIWVHVCVHFYTVHLVHTTPFVSRFLLLLLVRHAVVAGAAARDLPGRCITGVRLESVCRGRTQKR